jgi:hypothetical protein
MEDMRIVIEKPEEKRPLERPTYRLENIKTGLQDTK